jgi:hypothetical protein
MDFRRVKFARQTVSVGVLFSSLAIAASAGSCPAWTNCPIDGAQANKVDTEYQGIVAVGVFEHTTSTGQTHRFRMKCN